jgi:hypothetical protein
MVLGQSKEVFTSQVTLEFGAPGFQFAFAPQLVTDGITSATLEVPLPGNAVVQKFDVVVQAQVASATLAQNVAQIRANPGTKPDNANSGMSIVVDFGTPRTVSAVQLPLNSGMTILRVTPWIGTGFAPTPAYTVIAEGSSGTTATPGPNSTATTAILPSEVRTERLLVETLGTQPVDALAANMAVVLPEAPSGLQLRIDNGAPVFSYPGPAQPGVGTDLTDQWNQDSKRLVDIGGALASLTGDPTSTDTTKFKVVLSSSVPGVLNVTENDRLVLFVRRVAFGSDTSKALTFSEEGEQDLPLDAYGANVTVDPGAQISSVRFTAIGTLPPERVLPPVGPADANLADLVLTPNLAAIVCLPAVSSFGELTAVRLPLTAGSGGAEVRVGLWQSNKDAGIEPAVPVAQGVSTPVELSEGNAESWVTFPFKRPVAVDASLTFWAAVLMTRGQVTWSLGASAGPSDPIDGNVLRSGAPAGPWLPLPKAFVDPQGPFVACRGRVRVTGHAKKDVPIAPVLVSVAGGASLPVTPTAKGSDQTVAVGGAVTLNGAKLSVISLAVGTVTIQNLDVVATK